MWDRRGGLWLAKRGNIYTVIVNNFYLKCNAPLVSLDKIITACDNTRPKEE